MNISQKEKIQCKICAHIFETPILLPCGHTICKMHLKYEQDNNGMIKCPECHKHATVRKMPIKENSDAE